MQPAAGGERKTHFNVLFDNFTPNRRGALYQFQILAKLSPSHCGGLFIYLYIFIYLFVKKHVKYEQVAGCHSIIFQRNDKDQINAGAGNHSTLREAVGKKMCLFFGNLP